ncbi:MAG: cobaltochelatase subunit CobN [Synechococcus sp.]
MHRLASCPGVDPPEDVVLVEQPAAEVLFLSSAGTDLSTLSHLLDASSMQRWQNRIRALALSCLDHPAQLDHYLSTTACSARLIVVRLLGSRGHWSYGLDQLQRWQREADDRQLIVLAGTADQDSALNPLGSIDPALADALAGLLREGGCNNMTQLLAVVEQLLSHHTPDVNAVVAQPMADPLPWDWQDNPGARVGIVLYRALIQAGDDQLATTLTTELRAAGLCPRLIWVSGLRNPVVQAGVRDLLMREDVAVVITGTSFASVRQEDAGLGSPIWEQLNRPVLQMLSSSRPRSSWQSSSRGLDPLDLSLQVVMPELDGRITTRPCAFRDLDTAPNTLATAIPTLVPEPEGIRWLIDHVQRWVTLQQTPAHQRRIGLVLANYPVRDGRLANGVGLDTPASCVAILAWLRADGVDLGDAPLPDDGDALMRALLKGRTNDPESFHRPALDHLSLSDYLAWWRTVPTTARATITARWGEPEHACDLSAKGFPIHGLRFGTVVVLIQPDRGYDPDQIADLHSPDLPPPHRYLAQYLWLRQQHQTQLLVHVGKHGSAEWLPGKGVGLSPACGPDLALGAIPHLYPFIVNDPGEGSQAKRRGQAVILDHLTPPLGRAGLHGPLQRLESLLDEMVDARQMGSERARPLQRTILTTLQDLEWPGLPTAKQLRDDPEALDVALDAAETYLCELKESQIRTGLHRLGQRPEAEAERELLIALARAPQHGVRGLTQAMAQQLGLQFDPWSQEDGDPLEPTDQQRLQQLGAAAARRVADGTAWLEEQALLLVEALLEDRQPQGLSRELQAWIAETPEAAELSLLREQLWPRLKACAEAERHGVMSVVRGQRLAAGPSGAPSRGRTDVLPTGRNFYSVDLRGLPTEAAWDLGRRSAEQLLDLHVLDHGEPLRHLALSVWGTATMRNGGEDIAQLLALIGVRPVWDGPTRRLSDLEVIPLSLLGRPRVDVVLRISGLFRDAFPQLVGWVEQAQRMVASLNEPESENPLAALTRNQGSQPRIFGSAPGAYGAGLQALIDGGSWTERGDLGEAFLEWSQWRYDGGADPIRDRGALEEALGRVQVVLHNQDNREHDLLDSDDYYQFQGGLSAAVEAVSGERPELWFADHSRRERPRIHTLERELDKVMRSRLLNPRWLEGMQQHGYKGAFELGASLDYLFAYDAATGRVPDWSYGAICEQWLNDPTIVAFLSNSNPWVLRDMAERLLEAAHRGLWRGSTDQQRDQLKEIVNRSEALVERGGFTC